MNWWCCNLVPAIILHGQSKMSLLAHLVGSCEPCLAHSAPWWALVQGAALHHLPIHPSICPAREQCLSKMDVQHSLHAETSGCPGRINWADETVRPPLLGYGTRGHRFGSGREDESKFPLTLTGHDFTHIILILANANSICHPLFIFNSIYRRFTLLTRSQKIHFSAQSLMKNY